MSAAQGKRVVVERLDDVGNLTERAGFLNISTGSPAATPAPAGDGLQRNSLSRREYGMPKSPCSPTSPRIGECWRTGQASSHGGWFRPSPTKLQSQQQGMPVAPAAAAKPQ